jgi:hypothetical protein
MRLSQNYASLGFSGHGGAILVESGTELTVVDTL